MLTPVAGADAAGALCGDGDHELGRGDDLPTAEVVLAEPELVVTEPVLWSPAKRVHIRQARHGWEAPDVMSHS